MKFFLTNFRSIFLILATFAALVTLTARGCQSEASPLPPAEPAFGDSERWYLDVYAGVIMVYRIDGVVVEYAHPIIGNPEKAPFIEPIILEGDYFFLWTDEDLKYTVKSEPTLYRIAPEENWLPVVSKTWECGGCQ